MRDERWVRVGCACEAVQGEEVEWVWPEVWRRKNAGRRCVRSPDFPLLSQRE
ncbi:hypothetical protein Hanom_Chr05g00448051 [Helianthus anomalus]